ncbi:MAG: hypothetical protein V3S20_01540, partial [Dehalococcoidia bacterium]
KILFLIAIVLGAAAAVRRLLPAERRTQLLESLAEMPATMMERCMESMPEDSPPKVMVSSMRRFEEQNDELVGLIREQNKLLKKQTDILQAAASAGESQG